jgi:hypothetical protein
VVERARARQLNIGRPAAASCVSGSQAPAWEPTTGEALLRNLGCRRKRISGGIACPVVQEVRSRSFSSYPVPKQKLGNEGEKFLVAPVFNRCAQVENLCHHYSFMFYGWATVSGRPMVCRARRNHGGHGPPIKLRTKMAGGDARPTDFSFCLWFPSFSLGTHCWRSSASQP